MIGKQNPKNPRESSRAQSAKGVSATVPPNPKPAKCRAEDCSEWNMHHNRGCIFSNYLRRKETNDPVLGPSYLKRLFPLVTTP